MLDANDQHGHVGPVGDGLSDRRRHEAREPAAVVVADGDDVDVELVRGAEDGVGLEADLADDGGLVEMGLVSDLPAVSVAMSASDCNDSPSSP